MTRRGLLAGLLVSSGMASAQAFRPGRAAGFRSGLSFLSATALPSLYIGQVANNCRVMDAATSGTQKFMSRTAHINADDVTRLKLLIGNWRNAGGGAADQNAGFSQTYTGAFEYPAGTYNQITWGGATSVTNATTDDETLSDWCNVSIPAGATYWLRVYMTTTTGWYSMVWEGTYANAAFTPYVSRFPASVACLEYGAGVTDKTMGGTVAQTSNANAWFPLAIVAETRKPSVLIVASDSIGRGANDSFDTTTLAHGYLERAIGGAFGVLNASSYGDSASSFVTAGRSDKRQALKKYASHVISEIGCNDLATRTAAQITADITTALGYFSDKRCYRTTITPRSTESIAVSSLTSSGTTVTATTTAAHGISSGMSVLVLGASPSAYNGTFIVTVTSATTFTYTAASTPASSPATGTIVCQDLWSTAANQVVAASYAVGGKIDTVNASIRAGIPGAIAVFDPLGGAFDSASNKWLVDGTVAKYTGDGTHPSPFAHGQMGAQISSQVQNFSRAGL